MAAYCNEVTDRLTTLWPGWCGRENSGCTVHLSAVGRISLAAKRTYSCAGLETVNEQYKKLKTHLSWPQGRAE